MYCMNYSYILIQKLGLIKYLTLPAELEFEIEIVISTDLLLRNHKNSLTVREIYVQEIRRFLRKN